MRSEELNLFVEEFVSCFEDYIKGAKDLYNTSNPNGILGEIRSTIHSLKQTCLMLDLPNLTNFFQSYEEFLSRVKLGGPKKVPYALDKALDIGYKKFKEIESCLAEGKPKEKIDRLQSIETNVEIESFYSYQG
jgi:chemotaxis protein histidine kinase CheA